MTSKALTMARFMGGRLLRRGALAAELAAAAPGTGPEPPADAASARLTLTPGAGWQASGVTVRQGQSFTVRAGGTVWMAKGLALGFEPRVACWVRIGSGAPIAKLLDNETSFTAWADGPVELTLKSLGEWASPAGDLEASEGKASTTGAVAALVVAWPGAPAPGFAPVQPAAPPEGWRYLWRLGDGRIFAPGPDGEIAVGTRGDVGILQQDVDMALTPGLRLDWRWVIDALPSRLPEDLAPTHDYLSIAAEFDNGLDLTWMWSAGLPAEHVFQCPLPWWCERETHLVVRSGLAGLGRWHAESRDIAADYRRAIGPDLPARVVRLWLIAVSVFQRQEGRARFADITLR